jgi:hypothetical protein
VPLIRAPRLLRKIATYAGLVAIVAILAYLAATRARALALPTNDYVQYWAAGRLSLRGLNPYDPGRMLFLERSIGWPLDYPVMPYYPPWVLPVFMAMGLPSYSLSRVLWMLLSLSIVLSCAAWLWRFYRRSRQGVFLALAAAGVFAPTVLLLVEGQVTPLVLLGLAGFLWFERRRRLVLAAAFVALTLIKPLLFVLVWLALIVWVLDRRLWTTLAGVAFALAAALLVVLVANPAVLGDYVYYLGHYHLPATSDTATFAAAAGMRLGADRLWFAWLPLALGVVWFFIYWRKHRAAWTWGERLPLLLFASVLSAPYAWVHDSLVLLVAVIQVAVWLVCSSVPRTRRIASAAFLALNVLALALLPALHYNQAWYVWLPLAFLAWYLLTRRAVAQTSARRSSTSDGPAFDER